MRGLVLILLLLVAGCATEHDRAAAVADPPNHAARTNLEFSARLAFAARRVAAADWPAPPEDWPRVRQDLLFGIAERDAYDAAIGPGLHANRLKAGEDLVDAIDALVRTLRHDAPAEFAQLGWADMPDFANLFPIPVQMETVWEAALPDLSPRLAKAPFTVLQRLYGQDLPQAAKLALAKAARAQIMAENSLQPAQRTADRLLLGRKLLGAGFDVPGGLDFTVAMVEATSPALLASGAVHFKTGVEFDLPAAVSRMTLDQVLSRWPTVDADLVILMEVAEAKTRRRTRSVKDVQSVRIVGHDRILNPEWEIARLELTSAQADARARRSDTARFAAGGVLTGLLGGVDAALHAQTLDQKVEELTERLRTLPREIDKPIFRPYVYAKTSLEAEKTLTAHVHILDRARGTWFRTILDASDRKRFPVLYRMDPTDPEYDVQRLVHVPESHVGRWERQSLTIPLSQLLSEYVKGEADAVPLADSGPVLAALQRSRMQTPDSLNADYKLPLVENDPRMSAIAALNRGDGGAGSGFYVQPDVIMTNFHVVRGRDLIEAWHMDGRSTIGRVIAIDPERDLALVRVPERRTPLSFYTGNTLKIGAVVDALGQPFRFRFSVARGIISAVRRKSNVTDPKRQTWMVQTDADIHPGNSGGPLMLGDEVVAVVNHAASGDRTGFIPFAIHHREATAFLDEVLPNWRKTHHAP